MKDTFFMMVFIFVFGVCYLIYKGVESLIAYFTPEPPKPEEPLNYQI